MLQSHNPAYSPRFVIDDDVAMIHKVIYIKTTK